MPSKKGEKVRVAGGSEKENKGPRPSSPLMPEGKDPLESIINIVEKRARNLEKRKVRLAALQSEQNEGKSLDKDQCDAVSKLPEVSIRVDTLHDLISGFQQFREEYQKEMKRRQKTEDKQRRDHERDVHRSMVRYSLRIQQLLNYFDDDAKEAFRTGTDGAIILSEAELTQLDELYCLLNPTRAGNEQFDRQLTQGTNHLVLLFEKSSKEVVHTTYQSLYDLLERVDSCGYFDQVRKVHEEQQEEEEEEESDNTDKEQEEYQVPNVALELPPNEPFIGVESPPETTPSNQLPPTLSPPIKFGESPFHEPVPIDTKVAPITEGYHVSVPSPDFVGLQGSSAFSPIGDLTFMRDSPIHPQSVMLETQPQYSTSLPSSGGHPMESEPPQSFPTSYPPEETPPFDSQTTPLTDENFVPETGQQMADDKLGGGANKQVEQTSHQSRNSKGNRGRWGGSTSRPYNQHNGGYNGGNGYHPRGGYGGQPKYGSNNYQKNGSNRGGRPNYSYNRSSRGGGGGGGGGAYNSKPTRAPHTVQ